MHRFYGQYINVDYKMPVTKHAPNPFHFKILRIFLFSQKIIYSSNSIAQMSQISVFSP